MFYFAVVLILTLVIFFSAFAASVIDPYGTHTPDWDNIIPFTITGSIIATFSAIGVYLHNKQYNVE